MEIKDHGNTYRREEIKKLLEYIESEISKRSHLVEKYHKRINILSNIDKFCNAISVALSVGGITLLTTVVAIPAVISIESLALGLAISCIFNKSLVKSLSKKIKKHEQIKMLSSSKLNLIKDLVSRAINDDIVTETEFSEIFTEYKEYERMKEKIRQQNHSQTDEDLEKEIIELFTNQSTNVRSNARSNVR